MRARKDSDDEGQDSDDRGRIVMESLFEAEVDDLEVCSEPGDQEQQ